MQYHAIPYNSYDPSYMGVQHEKNHIFGTKNLFIGREGEEHGWGRQPPVCQGAFLCLCSGLSNRQCLFLDEVESKCKSSPNLAIDSFDLAQLRVQVLTALSRRDSRQKELIKQVQVCVCHTNGAACQEPSHHHWDWPNSWTVIRGDQMDFIGRDVDRVPA